MSWGTQLTSKDGVESTVDAGVDMDQSSAARIRHTKKSTVLVAKTILSSFFSRRLSKMNANIRPFAFADEHHCPRSPKPSPEVNAFLELHPELAGDFLSSYCKHLCSGILRANECMPGVCETTIRVGSV